MLHEHQQDSAVARGIVLDRRLAVAREDRWAVGTGYSPMARFVSGLLL